MKKVKQKKANGFEWKRLKAAILYLPLEMRTIWLQYGEEHGPHAARAALVRAGVIPKPAHKEDK